MLTEITPPAPEAGTGWIFLGSGTAIDIKVETTIEAGNFYRVDTGALVTLANPENLRHSRTMEVVGCIELNGLLVSGVDTPPGVPVDQPRLQRR